MDGFPRAAVITCDTTARDCVCSLVSVRGPRCVGDETSGESSLQGRCDSGWKTCTHGLAQCAGEAGEGRLVIVVGGWRIENTSHSNGRRHGPHLKLIQSGRDTQTEGQERFALALAEAMGGVGAGGVVPVN